MTLQPGHMLSHYRLQEKIGEGGMGVVWKATDTTLGREVAIKVLPELTATDAERLARFEREAKLLASLNHPGIATIHGFHQADGVRFLAMELAQGTTLAERLAHGALPIEEALPIGLQVAAALESAHEQGIVHRDLKPGNIQVSADGTVKVLDFGLAKALEPDSGSASSSRSPTLTTPATHAGVILGTAAYMSPEQAKGKPVDRRADIWAFGCVLLEMLTGTRTFGGDGVSEILAAVIMSSADLTKLPAGIPPRIRRLLGRCLEKDPRRRLRDIGEARLALEDTLAGVADEMASSPLATEAPSSKGGRWWTMAAGLLMLGAVVGAALTWLGAPAPTSRQPVRRFQVEASGPFRSGAVGSLLAISPDGGKVAWMESGRLRIRSLDRIDATEVALNEEPVMVFWSPDSAWLGYAAQGKLWKVPAGGGQGTILCHNLGNFDGGSGASWGPDGRIVLTKGAGGLFEVSALGGDAREFYPVDPNVENDLHYPYHLPDGSILFVPHAAGGRPDRLCLLDGSTRKELYRSEGQTIRDPIYSSSGHILFHRDPVNPGIWALPFSLSRHESTGEPFLVAADADVPSVSRDGTLVYAPDTDIRRSQLAWMDRSGKVVQTIGEPYQGWPFPAVSPDGRRVATAVFEEDSREIWVHDLSRGTRSRLTFGARASYGSPFWDADGRTVLYDEGGAWPFATRAVPADGGGAPRELRGGWSSALSHDGRYLVYMVNHPETLGDLYMTDMTSPSPEPVLFLKGPGDQLWPRVSPDGHYIVYVSDESGKAQIHLRRFPSGEGSWQVSTSGGFWPHWSGRGDRLYYVDDKNVLMEVDVDLRGHSPVLGNPKPIFTRPHIGWSLLFGWPAGFDVSPDGQRFLVNLPEARGSASSYTLVQNWFEEFRR